jgi:pimeloyl-ACP methyl ester carboxylesterase
MGQYVQIGDLKTWYDEYGKGDPVVLLHGGLVTNDTWGAQIADFSTRFHVIAPERQAHGHTPDLEGPLSYDGMAANTIGFLDEVVGAPADLVGWSDGGIVGLLVAIARPDLVRKLVAISANFDTTGNVPEGAEMLSSMTPDGEEMAMFRGMYAAASPDGAEHWPVMVGKFLEMVAKEPNITVEELARVQAPTLVMAGDDDVVALEHTTTLFRALPNAELAIVPGTSHALPMEKPEVVNALIVDFLTKEPVPTMMPIRRATSHPA